MIGKRCLSLPAVISVSLLILLPFPSWARGDTGDLKKRFMREYPRALERLRDTYSRIRGSGTETDATLSGGNWSNSTTNFTFRADGDNLKVSKLYDSTDKKYSNKQEIRSKSDNYAFSHRNSWKRKRSPSFEELATTRGWQCSNKT